MSDTRVHQDDNGIDRSVDLEIEPRPPLDFAIVHMNDSELRIENDNGRTRIFLDGVEWFANQKAADLIADLRKDAMRYRWLCNGNGYFMEEEMLCGHSCNEKELADEAIDSAMEEE